MNDVQLTGMTLTIIISFVGMLLGLIAYFMDRLIKQFDKLSGQFETLNSTMLRIDKDLSGDVKLLTHATSVLEDRMKDINPLFDRMRALEQDVTALKSGGCKHAGRCE